MMHVFVVVGKSLRSAVGNSLKSISIYCKNAFQKIHLELKNRWVMELYIVDEILADYYRIEKQNIQFYFVGEQSDGDAVTGPFFEKLELNLCAAGIEDELLNR